MASEFSLLELWRRRRLNMSDARRRPVSARARRGRVESAISHRRFCSAEKGQFPLSPAVSDRASSSANQSQVLFPHIVLLL